MSDTPISTPQAVPSLPPKRHLRQDVVVCARVAARHKQTLEVVAEEHDVTVSEYVRAIIVRHLNMRAQAAAAAARPKS
jgi:predicted transcriptional regulator